MTALYDIISKTSVQHGMEETRNRNM